MGGQDIYSEKFHSNVEALTFDDVLIVPNRSAVLPSQTRTETFLTRRIKLKIPIVSAAMDTVTDANMAIALAQLGGIGIVNKNFSPDRQADEVRKVKRFENIVITNPVVLTPDKRVKDARDAMKQYGISGIPIVDEQNVLQGIITRRDLDFIDFEKNASKQIRDVMTPRSELVTYEGSVDLKKAGEVMRDNRVEKLPIVDGQNRITGLITLKDITKIAEFPEATKDDKGRLRVGAAISNGPADLARLEKLADAGIDVIVVDTAHGHTQKVLDMVREVRKRYPDLDIVGGNIATAQAAQDLIEAGVDAVKVGMGPGSICTTRVVAGIGVPQVTAIMDVHSATRKKNIPIIADGGIKFSGDIAKAIAAGADTVMLGNLLAGTTESPGEFVIYKGRRYKTYRGMGSLSAMQDGSKSRYFQDDYEPEKLVPEGIEGRVPYKGDLKDVIYQLVGGLRSSMGYCGAEDVASFKNVTRFIKISGASLRESHPHDVIITKEAPNYMVEPGDN